MGKTINQLTQITEVADNDELAIYDVSVNDTKKTSVQNMVAGRISSAIGNAQSYSTEETLTGGTWVDGKPIYRKVLTGLNFGSDSGSWKNAGATVSSAESLIKGTVIRTQYNDILTSINVRIIPSTGVVQYYSVGTTFGGADIIILEYTKATTV